jgi:hypothetical protein
MPFLSAAATTLSLNRILNRKWEESEKKITYTVYTAH